LVAHVPIKFVVGALATVNLGGAACDKQPPSFANGGAVPRRSRDAN
jgi:hypothetical protein